MNSAPPTPAAYQPRAWLLMRHFSLFFSLFIAALAATRLLYEGFFPQLIWIGRPPAALGLAALAAVGGWMLWLRLSPHAAARPPAAAARGNPFFFLPLLLNAVHLPNPQTFLLSSRFIFAASLWLVLLLLLWEARQGGRWGRRGAAVLLLALLPLYLLTMPQTVGQADSFEFQVVIPRLGIVHPTGYPLYLLLAKPFTWLPLGSVAWRLNLATAVCAIAAVILLYLLLERLLDHSLYAALGAAAIGLGPTFWRQAIEAEVYALHALVVAGALWLMWQTLQRRDWPLWTLPAWLGLGLTNHLTTLFLLPPAALALLWACRDRHNGRWPFSDWRLLLRLAAAFLLPLLLYAYLPLRWQAVNGEPMGSARFVDWVVGGRFQDALQWRAWLRDPARYQIIGRLFLDNWPWLQLIVAGAGAAWLARRRPRFALLLALTWGGYTFYCLNYYVPDLDVFLLPAQLMIALCWSAGLAAAAAAFRRLWGRRLGRGAAALPLLFFIPLLMTGVETYRNVDRAAAGLTAWGAAVLNQPLAPGAAILADSEKIAPLYYLQQAEGLRPDLEIMVLPDEAAYRAELDARLAAGQPVYLARFLPGLAGVYHLSSAGPLTEVSTSYQTDLPPAAQPLNLRFGDLRLRGFTLEAAAAVDPAQTAVTLYWQAAAAIPKNRYVYVRWAGPAYTGAPDSPAGKHPANNNYPTVAWTPGEMVADYHLWPRPLVPAAATLALQVAVAPPFTPAADLAWQEVTAVTFSPAAQPPQIPLRMQVGSAPLTGLDLPPAARPGAVLTLRLHSAGPAAVDLQLGGNGRPGLTAAQSLPPAAAGPPRTVEMALTAPAEAGTYALRAADPAGQARCGWMQPVTSGCLLADLAVQGAALPADATNFADKIALTGVAVADTQLAPGGQLALTLEWQALAPLAHDYTVFVQVLNARDQIVGQVDSWPVQGTFPTSRWSPGQRISDPYLVPLDADLPPGQYRLLVGWYLLADLQRLPVLDVAGVPGDDKFELPGLVVP